jgi:hypothetical protein
MPSAAVRGEKERPMKTEFKHTRLALIIPFFFLFLSTSCGGGGGGGGGGGDDGGGDGGGQTLNEYNFQLDILADNPLRLSAAMGSATLEALAGPITGTYTLDSETISLNGGPMMKITTDLWDAPLGTLTINVNTPIESSGGDNPSKGEIGIAVGDSPYDYFIAVTITDTWVNLSLNGGEPVPYTWDEFDELIGSDKPDWQKQASFASNIVGFIFSQLNFDIKAITLIEENDTELSKRSVTINGDTFTGTPPAGHDAKGTLILSSTDGNVGPGSDFSEVFNDYWVNDPSDDIDQLYDGSVRFVGFLEDSDDARDVITAIGFVPNGADDPGGVFFDGEGLTIYETEETSGVFSIDEAATLTITGGYSIMFYEPQP